MNLQLSDLRIFSADYLRRASVAWESFLTGAPGAPGLVRDTIFNSWKRCREFGVSPSLCKAPIEVTAEEELRFFRHHYQDLLSAASKSVKPLSEVLSQSGSLLIVADARGVILECRGDASLMARAEATNIRPGGNWNESACGTNAIGTALALGRPVQVNAAEHYCDGVKKWACSAAPIRDPVDGEMSGVVDISGIHDGAFHAHSLALVISVARQIEALLDAQEVQCRNRLLEWCHTQSGRWTTDGLIVVDKRGRVVSASKNADAVLARHDMCLDSFGKNHGGKALGDAARFPGGIESDWLHPVTIDGEHVGSLVIIPSRKGRRTQPPARYVSPAGIAGKIPFPGIVRASAVMEEAVARAEKVARSTAPVLLEGETGVGKEEFAKCIHEASPSAGGPFVAVNCGALARDLVASELFGYTDGAFTGARRGGMAGKFEAADNGTLFLDEIGELPLEAQAHLLRVLQDGKVVRIGASSARQVNTRILAASNRNLLRDVGAGRFRDDLYYRLSVATLVIPPLRERREDIARLVPHFLAALSQKYRQPAKPIHSDAIRALEAYNWPGNVRELRNVLERMWLLSDSGELACADLPVEICCSEDALACDEDVIDGGAGGGTLRGLERHAIAAEIKRCGGNLNQAARSLGIARSTLYEKLARYGIKGKQH